LYRAYGDTTGDEDGGGIIGYTAASYDDSIDFYQWVAYEDDLYIGPDTDTDALIYDGANTQWDFNADVKIDGDVTGNITLDDDTTDSPTVVWKDSDEATLTVTKLQAGGSSIVDSDGAIQIQPSGDTGDYLTVETASDIITISTVGGTDGDLVVSAAGGDISFADENLLTTGTLGAGATTITGLALNSATPDITLTDTTFSGDGTGNLSFQAIGAQDIVATLQTDIAGTPTTFISLDGTNEEVLLGKKLDIASLGIENVGAIADDGAISVISSGGAVTIESVVFTTGALTGVTSSDGLTIGDGGSTNYTTISDTGAISQAGSATLTLQDGSDLVVSANANAGPFLADDGDTGTGTYDFGGATGVEIPNGTTDPASVTGSIALDTDGTDADFTGPVLAISTNGATMGYIPTMTDMPAAGEDNYIMKYDAGSNLFVWEADQDSGGAPALNAVTNPAAAWSIAFDDDEKITWTTSQVSAGNFLYIDNDTADVTGQVWMLNIDYSADDDQALADYILLQDSGGTVLTIQEGGMLSIGADPGDSGIFNLDNAAVISWEDATETTLTHVDNTGLALNTGFDIQGAAGLTLENDETITNSTDGTVSVSGHVEMDGTDPHIFFDETDGTDWYAGTDDAGNSFEIRTNSAIGNSVELEIDEDGDIHATQHLYLNAGDDFLGVTADDTFDFSRNDTGIVTITASDDDANAALTVVAGGTGKLTLGNATNTDISIVTDGVDISETELTYLDGVSSDIQTQITAAGTKENITPVDTGDENATFYPVIVDGATGDQATETDAEMTYNPSTDTLTVANFDVLGAAFPTDPGADRVLTWDDSATGAELIWAAAGAGDVLADGSVPFTATVTITAAAPELIILDSDSAAGTGILSFQATDANDIVGSLKTDVARGLVRN
jgi:hypothetical protein